MSTEPPKKTKAQIIEDKLKSLKEYAKNHKLPYYEMYDQMLKTFSIQQIVAAFEQTLVIAYCLDGEQGVRDQIKTELKLVNFQLQKPVNLDEIPEEQQNYILAETIFIIKVIIHGNGKDYYLKIHNENLRKKGITK